MDTLEFFRRILPSQGVYALAIFRPGHKPQHVFCDTLEIAAAAALKLDAKNLTVYHACASFKTKENRKAENAAFMRSFWVDLDVEPGNPNKYESLKDAINDIGRVCRELRLPLPLIVKSGRGCHGYWTLVDDLDAQQWVEGALLLKAVLDHLGCRQDRTRTADASSVLRPVGTHWRKNGDRVVTDLAQGTRLHAEDLLSRAREYADHHNVAALRPTHISDPGGSPGLNDDLIGPPPEYPPSSADRIIQFCPTLAYVAAQRGVVEEPLWRAMLGVVKYTTEGVQRCHEWSAGHPDYSEVETQEKIDRWVHGPTTCDHFRGTNDNRCTGCERKCTSPIQLGYTEEAPAPVLAPAVNAAGGGGDGNLGFTLAAAAEPQPIPHWPQRSFRWDGQHLCRAVVDGEGQVNWLPFCGTLFYPTKRVCVEDGTWAMQVEYVKRLNRRGEFTLPTALLGEPNKLHAALAAQEIVVMGTQGKTHAGEFLREYMLGLQSAATEQITYAKCGWADRFQSFIVGNKRISKTGEENVLTGEQLAAAGWARDFGSSGTEERWAELIDLLYNRARAEPYQFVLGAAFAAPLVEIAEIDNWHGIPVALTGESGTGKTTTTRLACSIYGKGEHFLRTATTEGSTLNAIIARLGVAKNLPVILDEATNRSVEEVCAILYMLSNGRPKDRIRVNGTIIDLGLSWNTIAFVTSNKSITEFLATLPERFVTEATQVRCFEIQLMKRDMDIWHDVNAMDVLEHQLIDQYGVVGRKWLRYVMENRGKLRDELRELRAKFNSNDAEETKERYFRDLVVSVTVALRHVQKLGLIKFDVLNVAKWAKRHVVSLRRTRHAHRYTSDDVIAQFLASLHGYLLVTQYCRDGRGPAETPLEPMRGAPGGRMALLDKVFWVTTKAVNDYCIENKLQASWLIEEMDRLGYIVHRGDETKAGARRERLCKGTNLPSTPTYVFELDYAKVFGLMNGGQDNVVQLPVGAATDDLTKGVKV